MPASRLRFPAAVCTAFLAGLLAITTGLHATEGGFAATLSADQQTAAGLAKLSTPERSALDQFVAMELSQVRQGEWQDLTGPFVSRRTDVERKSAGLDRLSPAELTRLNELVTAALSARPKPKERPRIKDSEVFNPAPKPELHGSISLMYGRGAGGRDFHGSSLSLDYFDPVNGFGLYVGVASFTGKGFYGYSPDYYDSPYYSSLPFYLESSGFGPPRESSLYGAGQSFLTPAAWDSRGRGYWRH